MGWMIQRVGETEMVLGHHPEVAGGQFVMLARQLGRQLGYSPPSNHRSIEQSARETWGFTEEEYIGITAAQLDDLLLVLDVSTRELMANSRGAVLFSVDGVLKALSSTRKKKGERQGWAADVRVAAVHLEHRVRGQGADPGDGLPDLEQAQQNAPSKATGHDAGGASAVSSASSSSSTPRATPPQVGSGSGPVRSAEAPGGVDLSQYNCHRILGNGSRSYRVGDKIANDAQILLVEVVRVTDSGTRVVSRPHFSIQPEMLADGPPTLELSLAVSRDLWVMVYWLPATPPSKGRPVLDEEGEVQAPGRRIESSQMLPRRAGGGPLYLHEIECVFTQGDPSILTTLRLGRGVWAWLGRHVGTVLEGDDGAQFVGRVHRDPSWILGFDYDVLKDERCAKALTATGFKGVATSSTIVLLEPGLLRAAHEAGEIGGDLRHLWATFKPKPDADEGDMYQLITDLYEAGQITMGTWLRWRVSLAEAERGQPLLELRPPLEQQWFTATDLAHRVGREGGQVRRAIKALGLKANASCCRRTMMLTEGGRQVEHHVYNDEAVNLLKVHFSE